MLATIDPQIRHDMNELLRAYRVNIVPATGTQEVQSALTDQDVLACFCGFWLVDGTYRDVVRLLKDRRADIRMVVVCSPQCPQEYRDYLAALNIRAFDFICHPYQPSDLDRILDSAVAWPRAPLRSLATVTPSAERCFETTGLRRAI